ncbi:hypothetical protein Goshw_021940, partial [Gossypium schwendimanii]|nr:hypothetical protein [Gossypium schwendimanii]
CQPQGLFSFMSLPRREKAMPLLRLHQIKCMWRPMILPDKYIDHGSQNDQIEEAGLSSKHIAATVLSTLGHTRG